MKCKALSVTTVKPCANNALPGKDYCGTHQAQHEAGTLMAPGVMREKRDALIAGIREGENVKALRERLGITQGAASAWITRSGVREAMAVERAEKERAREQAAEAAREEREAHLKAEGEAAEEAAALLRAFRPGCEVPRPMLPGLTPTFAFEPSDMLKLLYDVLFARDRQVWLPLHAALATVADHEVVMLRIEPDGEEAKPYEWGFLQTASEIEGGGAAWFEFEDWGFEEIGLAGSALINQDGIMIPLIDDEGEPIGGAVIVALAEEASDEAHFTLPDGLDLVPEREWLRALVEGPEPEHRTRLREEIEADLAENESS